MCLLIGIVGIQCRPFLRPLKRLSLPWALAIGSTPAGSEIHASCPKREEKNREMIAREERREREREMMVREEKREMKREMTVREEKRERKREMTVREERRW